MLKHLSLFMLVFAFFYGCNNSTEPEDNYNILYKVEGSATSVEVTVENYAGGTDTYTINQLPWTCRLRHHFTPGSFVYISAQNKTDSGFVKAEIITNEKVYKEETKQGGFGLVTISGYL